MTHEENSLRTKKALCNALKEILKYKSFSKITVSELVQACNMNRKTFYYHFEDIYDLLKWMLEQEAIEVVKQYDFLDGYEEAFNFVIDYVEENSYVLNCIYDSVGRDELKRFFYRDFIGLIEKIIRMVEEQQNICLSNDYRMFLCNLYTEGLAGMVINLFHEPEKYDRKSLTKYFDIVLKYSVPAAIRGYAEEKPV